MKKRPKYEFTAGVVLIVEWLDAHSVDDWTGRDELDAKLTPKNVRTIGFYVKTTKLNLVVAATLGLDGPDDDLAGIWAIPKGMIRSIREVST